MVLDHDHAFEFKLDDEAAQEQVIRDAKKYGMAVLKPKTDYISRETAKEHLLKEYPLLQKERLEQAIASIPAADVREVKMGKWVWNDQSKLVCSLCGNVVAFVSHPKKKWEAGYFCPNCGALMVNEEKRDD